MSVAVVMVVVMQRSLVHADLSLRHLLMEREDSIRLSDLGWPATSTDDKTLTHKVSRQAGRSSA